MKLLKYNPSLKLWSAFAGLSLILSGCGLGKNGVEELDVAHSSLSQNGGIGGVINTGVPGVPGASVPTAEAAVARIENGLEGNASSQTKNFRTALDQLRPNLPKSTNPTMATGFDQVPLLAYAACSDVSLTTYGLNTGRTIAQNRDALIAAGARIIDRHTNGLGSQGPVADQVKVILGDLVDKNAAVTGETLQMAFVSVCMAASTFGAQMMGF